MPSSVDLIKVGTTETFASFLECLKFRLPVLKCVLSGEEINVYKTGNKEYEKPFTND